MTDGQLLERFRTRDGEVAELAFAALLERHGPMVLRVCRRVLNDPHDAQDAFQATFLVLVRRADSDPPARLAGELAPRRGLPHGSLAPRSAAARRRAARAEGGRSR